MKSELVAGLAALLTCSPLNAQWSVEAAAGGTNHAQVASTSSLSAILGIQHPGPRWGYVSGGVPLDSVGVPWIVAGIGHRFERYVGGFTLGADAGGHGHAYRTRGVEETGTGFVAELIPSVGRSVGPVQVELASGARLYSNHFAGETDSRAVSDTNLRAVGIPAGGLTLALRGRYVRSADGGFPFAGAGIDLVAGNALFSAHAGRWLGELLSEPAWGASATIGLPRQSAVTASLEHEAPDPLFWNPARKSWSVGVSYPLGSRVRLPPRAPVQPRGPVHFTVPLAESPDPISVAGDFTGWDAVPMQRAGDVWRYTIPLEPGVYHYAFRRMDGSWFLPSSVASRVDDGFGGESAVLIVGADGTE